MENRHLLDVELAQGEEPRSTPNTPGVPFGERVRRGLEAMAPAVHVAGSVFDGLSAAKDAGIVRTIGYARDAAMALLGELKSDFFLLAGITSLEEPEHTEFLG